MWHHSPFARSRGGRATSSSSNRANMQDFTPERPSPLSHLAFASSDPDFDLAPMTNVNVSASMDIDPVLIDWPDDLTSGWPQSDSLDDMFGPLCKSPIKTSASLSNEDQASRQASQMTCASGLYSRSTLFDLPLEKSNSLETQTDNDIKNNCLPAAIAASLSSPTTAMNITSFDKDVPQYSVEVSDAIEPDQFPSHASRQGSLAASIQKDNIHMESYEKTPQIPLNQRSKRKSLPPGFMAQRALSLAAHTGADVRSRSRAVSMLTQRPSLSNTSADTSSNVLTSKQCSSRERLDSSPPESALRTQHYRSVSAPNEIPGTTSTTSTGTSRSHRPFTLICSLCELPFRPSAMSIRPDAQHRAYCAECIRSTGDRIVEEQKIKLGVGRKGFQAARRERIRAGLDVEDGMKSEEDENDCAVYSDEVEDDDDDEERSASNEDVHTGDKLSGSAAHLSASSFEATVDPRLQAEAITDAEFEELLNAAINEEDGWGPTSSPNGIEPEAGNTVSQYYHDGPGPTASRDSTTAQRISAQELVQQNGLEIRRIRERLGMMGTKVRNASETAHRRHHSG